MAPRKKNFNKESVSKTASNKQNISNSSKEACNTEKSIESQSTNNLINSIDDYPTNKFKKREISKNWAKYEEPAVDEHGDSMRGEDFQVLLSYCGGSKLQLQEEKEWGESAGKCISVDFQDLAHVKCIPLHKRLNLPDDIFEDYQIGKFNAAAEHWKKTYDLKQSILPAPKQNLVNEICDVNNVESGLLESYEAIDDVVTQVKSFKLKANTENIIESLTSSLSMKNIIPEKKTSSAKATDLPPTDDLDFLLCLNSPEKSLSKETDKKTNVDDWLDSILD